MRRRVTVCVVVLAAIACCHQARGTAGAEPRGSQASATSQPEAPRMGPREVFPNTALVKDGAAQFIIVYPGGEQGYAALARSLTDEIHRLSGARGEVKSDAEVVQRRLVVAPEHRQTHLIVLGNLNNNQAVFFLYGNHFTRVDRKWPGPNGFVVQTIGNPYGTKHNVIMLGGSDRGGVEQAGAYFVKQVKQAAGKGDLALPFLWKIVVDGKEPETPPPAGSEDDYMKFQGLVTSYMAAGSPSMLAELKDFLKAQVAKGGSLFHVGVHYRAIGVLVALDLIDDTGILSPQELAVIDNVYLDSLRQIYKEKP